VLVGWQRGLPSSRPSRARRPPEPSRLMGRRALGAPGNVGSHRPYALSLAPMRCVGARLSSCQHRGTPMQGRFLTCVRNDRGWGLMSRSHALRGIAPRRIARVSTRGVRAGLTKAVECATVRANRTIAGITSWVAALVYFVSRLPPRVSLARG
jgi:hypothetical protein